jgi:sec-independent protein translocase protein TatA
MATIILGFLGSSEIIIIVLAVVLLFGGKKIPELMRGLGGGIKEFKEAAKTDEEKAAEAKKKELNGKE